MKKLRCVCGIIFTVNQVPEIYAHTLPNRPRADWEPLGKHLEAVAELAGEFAKAFDARLWGQTLGHWHDLGKHSAEFQRYLEKTADPDAGEEERASGRVDHSTFGARHAGRSCSGMAGQLLAFCIAGHHAGLADATTTDEEHRRSTLTHRLDEQRYIIPPVSLPADFPSPPVLKFPFAPPAIPPHGTQQHVMKRALF